MVTFATANQSGATASRSGPRKAARTLPGDSIVHAGALQQVFAEERIFDVLRQESLVSVDRLQELARKLFRRHRQLQEKAQRDFFNQPEYFVARQKQQLVEGVRQIAKEFLSCLPPVLQLGVGELQSVLSGFVAQNEKFFYHRGGEGWIGRSRRILSFTDLMSAGDPAALIAMREVLSPAEDVMADAATLVVDLEIRGFGRFGALFEETYRSECEEHSLSGGEDAQGSPGNQRFQLQKIRIALQRAAELLRASFHTGGAGQVCHRAAVKYVAFACRLLLAKSSPFVITVAGENSPGKYALAAALGDLLFAASVGAETMSVYDLVNQAALYLGRGIPVVMTVAATPAALLVELQQLKDKFQIPVSIVHFSIDRCEPRSSGQDRMFGEMRERGRKSSGAEVSYGMASLNVEAIISTEELAFYVARELRL